MKANILTIGTEITSGEIVNSNAAWIAARLEAHGYTVSEHRSVRDEAASILAALKDLQIAPVLIVTGGLGPTSDDVTRAAVAKWSGKALQFSEPVWKELAAVYKKRGLPLREAHRHQCHFPQAAILLKNPVGTAHGFSVKKGKCIAYVLPGPPREMEGMWTAAVESSLEPGGEMIWHHWTCLGMPESETAEKIEALIADLDLEVGYRASVPYVYLKLRGKKISSKLIATVDAALGEHLVGKDKEDFVVDFVKGLKGDEIFLQDQVTNGFLAARLAPILRHFPNQKIRIETCWNDQPSSGTDKTICGQILFAKDDEHGFDVIWRDKKNMQRARIQLPFKMLAASERGAKSAADLALFKWWNWIKA